MTKYEENIFQRINITREQKGNNIKKKIKIKVDANGKPLVCTCALWDS